MANFAATPFTIKKGALLRNQKNPKLLASVSSDLHERKGYAGFTLVIGNQSGPRFKRCADIWKYWSLRNLD